MMVQAHASTSHLLVKVQVLKDSNEEVAWEREDLSVPKLQKLRRIIEMKQPGWDRDDNDLMIDPNKLKSFGLVNFSVMKLR